MAIFLPLIIWAGIVERSDRKMLHLAAMCVMSGTGLILAVYTGSFDSGLLVLAGFLFLSASLVGVLKLLRDCSAIRPDEPYPCRAESERAPSGP